MSGCQTNSPNNLDFKNGNKGKEEMHKRMLSNHFVIFLTSQVKSIEPEGFWYHTILDWFNCMDPAQRTSARLSINIIKESMSLGLSTPA